MNAPRPFCVEGGGLAFGGFCNEIGEEVVVGGVWEEGGGGFEGLCRMQTLKVGGGGWSMGGDGGA